MMEPSSEQEVESPAEPVPPVVKKVSSLVDMKEFEAKLEKSKSKELIGTVDRNEDNEDNFEDDYEDANQDGWDNYDDDGYEEGDGEKDKDKETVKTKIQKKVTAEKIEDKNVTKVNIKSTEPKKEAEKI